MSADFTDEDYFWVPINWDVAEYLLKHYREDWEGITPNGTNLDSWYQNLKEASEKHSRIHFHFPHIDPEEKEEGEF